MESIEHIQPSIELRTVTDADRDFLLRVYEASREIELGMTGWNSDLRRAFVEHQFTAQDSHYREHYGDASFDLILFEGKKAGRLIVSRCNEEIEILDITVLPEFRNRGIATSLVRSILAEAKASGQVVVIYIESFNPSQDHFGKLGFIAAGGDELVRRFEWKP
jgi:ribosomal protein S18 acetylase RimI-like enzyme